MKARPNRQRRKQKEGRPQEPADNGHINVQLLTAVGTRPEDLTLYRFGFTPCTLSRALLLILFARLDQMGSTLVSEFARLSQGSPYDARFTRTNEKSAGSMWQRPACWW